MSCGALCCLYRPFILVLASLLGSHAGLDGRLLAVHSPSALMPLYGVQQLQVVGCCSRYCAACCQAEVFHLISFVRNFLQSLCWLFSSVCCL